MREYPGEPDEHPSQCPSDAAWSRAHGARNCRGPADAAGRRTSRRRLPAHRAQMGRPLQGRRAGRIGRPFITPATPATTDQPAVVDQVIGLRRQRLPGQHIAKTAGVSPATFSRILKRAGLSRLKDLEPPGRCGATNASTPASSSTSTSRSSAASTRSATASPATAGGRATHGPEVKAPAGSSSMSASTTPRASPSP